MPTFLALAGVPKWKSPEGMDGIDMSKVLKGTYVENNVDHIPKSENFTLGDLGDGEYNYCFELFINCPLVYKYVVTVQSQPDEPSDLKSNCHRMQ